MNQLKIQDYITEAEALEKLFYDFVEKCTHGVGWPSEGGQYSYTLMTVSESSKPIQRELLRRYETWYAVCKGIIRQYSDRYDQFIENYDRVKSHIQLKVNKEKDDLVNRFIYLFDEQVNILHTVLPIISATEMNFKKLVTADLLNSELDQAEVLFNHDFHRAAGAIAGVVLERYLKTLCEMNNITIQEKDTIEPLATKLYKSDKLQDFDLTLFKSIQHLASIRNKCTHPKEDVKAHEVRELLDKVNKITFIGL